jgi:predicted HicB family RNase H-like nuclease
MSAEIRCKRIIGGKTYNTETATLLGHWQPIDCPDPFGEALFKTRHGAYFLWSYNPSHDFEEAIKPQTPQEAQAWMESNCTAEMTESEFGEMPEAGDPEARITLRVPDTLHQRIAALAEAQKQSLNAWILRCVERCAAASSKLEEPDEIK